MNPFRIVLIVLMFCCLLAGFVMVAFAGLFARVKGEKNTVNERKALRNKLIGYVILLLAFAFAIFQSLVK